MMAVRYSGQITGAFIMFSVICAVRAHIEPSLPLSEVDTNTDPLDMRRDLADDSENGLSIDFNNHEPTIINQHNNVDVEMPSRRSPYKEEHNKDLQAKMYHNAKEISTPGSTLTTHESIEETTTTSTTEAYPPLNRRYRRIYNPDEVASIEECPFVAALLVNNELWCGGVIIDKDKVLTAAHCLQLQYNNRFFREYVKMLTVRVGSTNATAGGELLRVSEIFFHPNYKPQALEFNFAVIKLHRNLTFGSKTLFIESIPYTSNIVMPVDNQVVFLGWGSVLGITGAGGQVLLQKVTLPVYDTTDCQDVYGKELVSRTNFCAGYITIPKNVCNHDAGGPAIMDGVLVGILSFSSKRCDQPDQPAVFSIVGAVEPWLSNLGNKKVQLLKTAIKTLEMAAN